MKAITPLISVILLLLITIAIVGFTYTWFTRFSEDVTEELSNETEVSGSRAVRIEALSLQTVTLKNIGTRAILVEDLQIYVNDIPTTCSFGSSSILPGQIATCTNLIEPCTFGSSVRVTTSSGFDVYTCPVSPGTTTTVTTTTTLPGPPLAYLSVVLDTPIQGSSNNILQNGTFVVRANVTCVGTVSCGNVNGTIRYNSSGTEPNTPMNTTQGSKPLFIIGSNGLLALQVASSSDDAHQFDDGSGFDSFAGFVIISSSTVASSRQNGGYRFTNVAVPKGAIINSAILQVFVHINDDADLEIFANAVDNASNFSAVDVTSRTRTSANITWIATDLTGGGLDWRSPPNIAPVVQEVINRPGWTSGNAIALLLDGRVAAGSTLNTQSFDFNPPNAAKLDITYTTSPSTKNCGALSAGQTCQLNWTVNASGAIGTNWNIDSNFASDNISISNNNTGNAQVNIIAPVTTIFFDTFTEASDIHLEVHTPNVGTSWTIIDGVNNRWLDVKSATDVIGRLTADFIAGSMYTADTSYPSADYNVTVKAVTVGSAGEYSWLFARIQDTNNFYAFRYLTGAGGTQIYKKVGGTSSTLGSAFSGPVNGDNVTLRVNGNTIDVYYNGIQQQSVIDSSIVAAGKAGIGAGGITGVSGGDLSTQEFDNFKVETI